MAEKLTRPQPSSSIANELARLTSAKAASALAPPGQRRPKATRPENTDIPAQGLVPEVLPPTPTEPTGEAAGVDRQFKLTPTADETLDEIISVYSKATGVKLTQSEWLRVVLRATKHTMDLHQREAASLGRLKRPKNEPTKFHIRDAMEHSIARAFVSAMRAAAPLE